MTTVEQVMETVGTLPFAERQRLLQQLQQQLQQQAQPELESPESLDAVEQERAEKLRHELEEYRRAKQWIAAHRAEYLNQWVALEGGRLISHGSDALQVDAEARAAGIEIPFVVHLVEAEPQFFYYGW